MPRYFFDVHERGSLVRDHTGCELPDLRSAHRVAVALLMRLLAARSDVDILGVQIKDASDALLAELGDETSQAGGETQAGRDRVDEDVFMRLEDALGTNFGQWLLEQRRLVEQLSATGQDTRPAEAVLNAMTALLAERFARRIRAAALR